MVSVVWAGDYPVEEPPRKPHWCERSKALIGRRQRAGVEVVGGPDPHLNGRFAWVLDPEGRKIELWEPAAGH